MSSFESTGNPGAWHPDPTGRHQLRWWDGSAWTDHVSDDSRTSTDPVRAAPAAGQPYASNMPTVQARSLQGLATALTVLLPVASVVCVLYALALIHRASIIDDPFDISFTDAQDADNAVRTTAVLFVASLVATGVVWIVWQHRHATNARLLGQTEGLTPGWAIGGWFVPIGNFFLPQSQLRQAAKASVPAGRPAQAPASVILWWVLFTTGSVIGAGSRNGSDSDTVSTLDDLRKLQFADRASAISALILVGAALAGIAAVRTTTANQHQALIERGFQIV